MSKGSDMWSCKYKNNAEGTILRMLCTMLRLAITYRMHARASRSHESRRDMPDMMTRASSCADTTPTPRAPGRENVVFVETGGRRPKSCKSHHPSRGPSHPGLGRSLIRAHGVCVHRISVTLVYLRSSIVVQSDTADRSQSPVLLELSQQRLKADGGLPSYTMQSCGEDGQIAA